MFLEGMLRLGEVNLTKLCCVMHSDALPSSCYKRLRRFVAQVWLDQRDLARFLVMLMPVDTEQWHISMDRTNWRIGKTHVNILYICICYKGMGIPLFWSFLEDKKQGNSDHIDRIDLMELFIDVFGKERIAMLLMDREFCGKEWVEGFLQAQRIPYVLRLKDAKTYMANSHGKMRPITQLFHTLKPGGVVVLGKRKVGKSNTVTHNITALRTNKGELVVLAHSSNIEQAENAYRYRWNIEHMFKAFKSSGFNLEDTRITHPDRLQTLTSIMAIAFCIAYKQGNEKDNNLPIKKKNHGYRETSIFRQGLNIIQNALTNTPKIIRKILKNIIKYHADNASKALQNQQSQTFVP